MSATDDDQKKVDPKKSDSSQNPTPAAQSTPVSMAGGAAPTKESEPTASSLSKSELKSAPEHTLSPEVIDYIKKQEAAIKVPEALKNMGVNSGIDEDLIVDGPTLPISDTKIVQGLQQPINSSVRWLAELAIFILKQAHYTVKLINGHIKRIIYTGKD